MAPADWVRIFCSYTPLLTVARVPMTPMRPVAEVATALSTAGVITSKMGTSNSWRSWSEAMLAAVLQAMMISLAPRLSRNSVSWRAYLVMVSGLFEP